MNRERWLNALAAALHPTFAAHGHALPTKLNLSCGYPSKGGRSKAVGECHYPADSHSEIFVRPDQADSLEVAAIVLHELVHAALGPGFAHGKEFKKLATTLGLEGKMRSTTAGPLALATLEPILQSIGPYPHTQLNLASGGRRAAVAIAHRNMNCPACGFHAKVREDQLSWGRLACPADGQQLMMKCETV